MAHVVVFLFLTFPAFAADSYDLVIRGGDVIDGSGTPAFRADVAVEGGRISSIGDLADATATRVIDASGKTVIPGIIDLHSHADGPGETGGLRHPDKRRRAGSNMIAQGVTTVVVNQDGRSLLDIAKQREELEERGHGPNVLLMVGHNSVRQEVMKSDFRRAARLDEIEAMAALVKRGMDAGAWGVSAGLEYTPGIWSETDELIALVEVIKPYGGVYIVHERASGSDPMWYLPSQHDAKPTSMIENIAEQIRIAEATGVTTVCTHIKARGKDFWGSSAKMIAMIREARDRGVPIWADQYPYTTSGSDGDIVLIPRWAGESVDDPNEGGGRDYADALRSVLTNDKRTDVLNTDVDHQIVRRGGPENIVIMDYPDRRLVGKTLAEAALAAEISPRDMVFRLQMEGFTDRPGGVELRGFSMSEEDVKAFAAQPWVMTASDAGLALPGDPDIHARFYGTFPRKIRRYAIEKKLLSVEQAVRSMTGLPAQVLGLKSRGLVKQGFSADLAVIDLATIRDTNDFFNPHSYPDGIGYVLVNGEFAVDAGELTWALPGKVLTPSEQ